MARNVVRLIAVPLLTLLVAGLAIGAAPIRASWAIPPVPPAMGPVPGPGPAPVYRWPLAGPPLVTRPFQPPPHPWLPGHRGVDLAAAPGATVFAAGKGVVAFAGVVAGVGVVSLDHPDGLRTTYEPVAGSVRIGQSIALGQPIGAVLAGHPGCPAAACLHWGLRRDHDYLDPLMLLRMGRVRLLPLVSPGGSG